MLWGTGCFHLREPLDNLSKPSGEKIKGATMKFSQHTDTSVPVSSVQL